MNTENKELEMAWDYAMYTHRNIFLTGKAGTGKTTFLRRLAQETRKRMIVVAPTGVAAINAGGVTIHSMFQLAPGLFMPGGRMVAGQGKQSRYSFSKQKANILRSLSLLVIDEVSMVRADLLDAVDDVLRRFQDRDRPFGGVQLLLIGDLQQLAPVATEEEWQVLRECYTTPYFFSSTALQQTNFVYIELKHIYRQQGDQAFVQLLNAVRDNRLTPSTLQALNARYQPGFRPPDGEDWITLTTHNAQASQLNARRMAELKGEPVSFKAAVSGDFPESSYPTDALLTLKVGAQVMFCKNDPSSAKLFYNGLIGRVEAIKDGKVTVRCKDAEGGSRCVETGALQWDNTRYVTDAATATIREETVGSFSQIPLRTAWAITIHKSQGLTFDHAVINAGRAFSHGQIYVALSRCRSLQGLVLATPISADIITTDPAVTEFSALAQRLVPSAETLILDRRSFVEDILCVIFDFHPISLRLRYLERLVLEHMSLYYPAYAHAVSAAATEVENKLASVGGRFGVQIHQLIQGAATYSANPLLRERVHKAVAYFTAETARSLGEFLDLDIPEIDNSRASEQIASEHALLRSAYAQKMQIFIGCANEFSPEAYWEAKARAAMEPDAPKRERRTRKKRTDNPSASKEKTERKPKSPKSKKATISYETIRDKDLYHRLLDWRKSEAREKKLPPGYIMQIKTIIGITNLLPRTIDELLTIPGIGKATAEQYGSELLEMVRQKDEFLYQKVYPVNV